MGKPTQQTPTRRIGAEDIWLGFWLVVGCRSTETVYLLLTWSHPHRTPIMVLVVGGIAGQVAFVSARNWLLRERHRVEIVLTSALCWHIAVVVAIASLDGGVTHSPFSALLFVPVVFAALVYPFRQAVMICVAGLAGFVVLLLVRQPVDPGALVFATSLAAVSVVGLFQAARSARQGAEIDRNHESLSASEQRFRGSFEYSPVGMAMLNADEQYIAVNDALCRMLGRSREWIGAHSFRELTHPDDLARDASVTRGLREGAFDHTQFEKRYRHADGHVVHALVSKSVVRDDDGGVLYFHLQAVDVTEQRRDAQRSRRRARQQAAVAAIGQRALDGAPVSELFEESVVAIQDTLRVPEAGVSELLPDGHLVVRAARGYEIGMLINPDPATTLAGLALRSGEAVLMDDSETEARFDARLARSLGERSGMIAAIPGEDVPYGVLTAHSDQPRYFEADDLSFLRALATVLGVALNRDAAERRLRHLSLHDTLTGLPNRALLLDRMGHALDRAQRTDEILAVMFLDVDHFKTVNDAYGHNAGDELLRALTPRLREALRIGDTLARFGGDEFVVLCEGLQDAAGAVALAERLLDVFSTPFLLGASTDQTTEHHLGASIGVAVAAAEHAGDPAALIRDADIAMYRAKQVRGRVELFDQTSRTRVAERVRTTSELRTALDEEQLVLVYQPQVDLLDGAVHGVEALLRWEHPERGLVLPDEFIPIAEESGLILPIGEWILDTVLRQMAAWDASGDPLLVGLEVGVNLSARQLVERWLPELVSAALERHALSPARLICEITETALIDDPVRASQNVEALAACGVSVALDDFCTGSSALEHLKRFSLAGIKLDRTFVADLATSHVDMSIVRGLVEMATAMDLNTVAEGIETPDQLARLRELGCDQAQGYLFAPGLRPEELVSFLHDLPDGRLDLARLHASTRPEFVG